MEEKDYKEFRKFLPLWQERYIENLLNDYRKILDSNQSAGDRFFQLKSKIVLDSKSYGVRAPANRNNADRVMINLIINDIICEDDVKTFTDEYQERLRKARKAFRDCD